MPTYEYACSGCGNAWEEVQKITEPALEVCPACKGSTAKRQISGGSFILKGGGWYADLYSSSKNTKSDKGEASAKEPSSKQGDGGGESKGESKSAGGGESKSGEKGESKKDSSSSSSASSGSPSGSSGGSTPSKTAAE